MNFWFSMDQQPYRFGVNGSSYIFIIQPYGREFVTLKVHVIVIER
jgi:hypothetical protein